MRARLPKALERLIGEIEGLLEIHRANLRSRTYPRPDLNPPTIPHEVIPVRAADGARLRVHAYGPADGQVVVLIHGWTCCLEYWNPQINAFAENCRIIAFDLRGHGESELGEGPVDCHRLADDLDAVLSAVLRPGKRAVLVGHSLGGMTLQAWASRYPHRVAEQAAAVLLTNTGPRELVAETTVVPLFNRMLPGLNRVFPLPMWLARRGLGATIVFPPVAPVRWIFARQIMTLSAERELVEFGMNIVRSCRARVRAEFGLLLADMDLGDSARNLVVPTTVVAGSEDFLTPVRHSELIAGWLKEAGSLAGLVVLPTGHLGNLEMIDRFNAELGRVLDSVRHSVEAAG